MEKNTSSNRRNSYDWSLVNRATRTRGTPIQTWIETVKKNVSVNSTENMALNKAK